MSGWRLAEGIEFTFESGTTIGAGDYLVIAKDPVAFESATGISDVLGGFTGSLSNGGETIHLLNHNDQVMDELIYGDSGQWPVAADGSGAALAKRSEHAGTGDPDSWTFSSVIGGTPGSVNQLADSPLILNEVAGAIDANFRVELVNNSGGSINLSGYSLALDGSTQTSFALSGTIAAGGYLSFDQASSGIDPEDEDRLFLIGPGNSVLDGTRVENGARARSEEWAGRWQRPDTATFGSENSFNFEDAIVINEILYNQLSIDPVKAITSTEQLIDLGSTWRYNETVDLGQDWATSSHAVGADGWLSGQGVLGVENSSPVAELIQSGTDLTLGRRTYYFETDFQFTGDPDAVSQLQLTHLVDDGAIFYLNGVEVSRFNFAEDEVVDANTLVDSEKFVRNAALRSLLLDTSSLVTGTNRLSVEVHQVNDTSSDIVFGAALESTTVIEPGISLAEDPEEWIELHNKSGTAVDLSEWELGDGIEFTFAPGTVLGAGEYLVVARDQTTLAAKYPDINIAGEFDGRLSNSTERIQLLDSIGNLADEVRYYEGGAFDERADGDGSSLELRDPDADNSNGQAWAASAPSPGQWQTVSYTGTAVTPEIGYHIWHEFVFNLLQAGEVLIDDLSVIANPGTASATELIQDGTFSSGSSLLTYRGGGNHSDISIVSDPDNPSESVLRLHATGPPEHNFNHVETTLANGAVIQEGTTYQISYRAKWISGSNQLGTRLYFNYLPHTERLERPRTVGTPGAVNSTVETNVGPTHLNLTQSVVTPAANQAVTISVRVDDPDGVNNAQLWYRVDEGAWNSVAMNNVSAALYQSAIPGQSAGAIVQFYVESTDSQGASATFPADGANSRALYKVATSASNSKNSIQVITLESESDRLIENSNASSNLPIGATVVDETGKIYYDVGFRLRGSSASRTNNRTRGYWIGFNPEDFYRGVHESIIIDRARPNQVFSNHLLQAVGDVPSFYEDAVNFVSPDGSNSGQAVLKLARYGDVYLDGKQDNGSDGNVFDFDLLYTPTSTVDGDPESVKNTTPLNHTDGSGDFTSYGFDKELYRHTFTLRNNREEDDFSGLIQFLSAFDFEGDELYAQVDQFGDIDQIARVFTALSLLGMNDIYTRIFQHNLRLYENPDTGKFEALPWDLDSAFRLPVNSALWSSPEDGQINKLFDLPQVSRLMYGHADHMMQTTFNRDFAQTWATHFGAVSGANLSSNLNYVEDRANVVTNQLPDLAPYAITTFGGADFSVDFNQVTLQGTGSYKVRDLRVDGLVDPVNVTWLDDVTWQATLNLEPGVNDLTIRAHDYFGDEIHSDTITVTSTSTAPLARDVLRITEIHYNPTDPATTGRTCRNN